MPRINQLKDRYARKDLGAHIGGRIKASGMTQQEFGNQLGVCQQTISRWIRTGNVTIEQLQKITKVIPLEATIVMKAVNPWGTQQ